MNFDSKYYSVNGTMLQSDDPNAFNYVNNATAISPMAIAYGMLPMPGASNATSTPTSMTSTMPMTTTSANGQGVTTDTSTVSASSTTAASKRDLYARWDNGTTVWNWEVPVFGSFVLQFNP